MRDWGIPENKAVQCGKCKHHFPHTAKCDAFPYRIPIDILMGRFDHTKPFEGDQGIQFEPRKEVQ